MFLDPIGLALLTLPLTIPIVEFFGLFLILFVPALSLWLARFV